MRFDGTWNIQEMEMWDEDYFNMEVQAYIRVKPNGHGEFQFGLVSGQIDGEKKEVGSEEVFFFTWEGNDESDPAQGAGILKLKEEDTIEGWIKLHFGDSSTFIAERTI